MARPEVRVTGPITNRTVTVDGFKVLGVQSVEVREGVHDVPTVVITIVTDNAAVEQPQRP
jgi:hypothetical protein